MSDVLLPHRRHDPSPSLPESPTPPGQPSDFVSSAGRRIAAPPSVSSGASAFSRLGYSARRTGYTFTRSPYSADLSMAAMTSLLRTASAESGTVLVPFSLSAANAAYARPMLFAAGPSKRGEAGS